jgi:hypothetical protein
VDDTEYKPGQKFKITLSHADFEDKTYDDLEILPTQIRNVISCGATGDGSTDDTTAIQSAIDGGGPIYFPAGTYIISSPLTSFEAGQLFYGDGWSQSVIYQNSVASGKHGLSIGHSECVVRDLQIKSDTQTGNEGIGIYCINGDGSSAITDILVENCYINKFSYGVVVTNGTRAKIRHNRLYCTGDDSTDTGGGVQISIATDCDIIFNEIDGDPDNRFQNGIYISTSAQRNKILYNRISNFYSYGIQYWCNTGPIDDVWIVGNNVHDVNSGLILSAATTPTGTDRMKNIHIEDNKIHSQGGGSYNTVFAAYKNISNVWIDKNYFEEGTEDTLRFNLPSGGTWDNIYIRDNVFNEWPSGEQAVYFYKASQADSEVMRNVHITGNTLIGNATKGTNPINLNRTLLGTIYKQIVIRDNKDPGDLTDLTSAVVDDLRKSIHADYGENSWDTVGSAVVIHTATGSITAASHEGVINLLGEVGGDAEVTLTLPEATGSGAVYRFVVSVVNTSSYIIKTADATNCGFRGSIDILDIDSNAQTAYFGATNNSDDIITLNGTTSGGLIGDWIEVTDILTDAWVVRGQVQCAAGSSVASMFSST